MDVLVNTQISLLMETADLLFVYFNQMDPAVLTSDKPYCIPPHEVKRIMEEVCGDLDLKDRRLKFFFRSFTIDNFKHTKFSETCVAIIMLHSFLRKGISDLQVSRKVMHDHCIGSDDYFEITSFNPCGIGTRTCEEYRSIAEEIGALDMPDGLRLQLLEVLSNYHRHVDQLCDLLEPLAHRLLLLLEPWWEKITPRLEQWRTVLNTEAGQKAFFAKVNMDTSDLERLEVSFHLLRSSLSEGIYNCDNQTLFCNLGMDIEPVNEERDTFSPVEVSALRLLSNADRIEMLRAMKGGFMTPKELTERLNLYCGSVFRDLNNMFQAHLLEMEVDGIHRSYKTNVAYLERLVARLVEYIKT